MIERLKIDLLNGYHNFLTNGLVTDVLELIFNPTHRLRRLHWSNYATYFIVANNFISVLG